MSKDEKKTNETFQSGTKQQRPANQIKSIRFDSIQVPNERPKWNYDGKKKLIFIFKLLTYWIFKAVKCSHGAEQTKNRLCSFPKGLEVNQELRQTQQEDGEREREKVDEKPLK